jgi:hypothetical protein
MEDVLIRSDAGAGGNGRVSGVEVDFDDLFEWVDWIWRGKCIVFVHRWCDIIVNVTAGPLTGFRSRTLGRGFAVARAVAPAFRALVCWRALIGGLRTVAVIVNGSAVTSRKGVRFRARRSSLLGNIILIAEIAEVIRTRHHSDGGVADIMYLCARSICCFEQVSYINWANVLVPDIRCFNRLLDFRSWDGPECRQPSGGFPEPEDHVDC